MCGHHAPELRIPAAHGLKAVAKTCPQALRSGSGNASTTTKSTAGVAATALFEATKDSNARVRSAADRALIHLLQVHTRPATVVRKRKKKEKGS